jgi:AcrR family transcriptional regulator
MKSKDKLTPRKIKALETKKNLLDTALNLFAAHGFETVTVEDIVNEAKSSKGAFYNHFKSKDQIIIEQYRQLDDYYFTVGKSFKNTQTAKEKLLEFVHESEIYVVRKLGLDITKIVYSVLLKNNVDKAFIVDESRNLYKIIKEIIEEGQKSGEFRSDISADELCKMFIRCMRGSSYDWCLYEGNFDYIEDGQRFFSIFIDGVLIKH